MCHRNQTQCYPSTITTLHRSKVNSSFVMSQCTNSGRTKGLIHTKSLPPFLSLFYTYRRPFKHMQILLISRPTPMSTLSLLAVWPPAHRSLNILNPCFSSIRAVQSDGTQPSTSSFRLDLVSGLDASGGAAIFKLEGADQKPEVIRRPY